MQAAEPTTEQKTIQAFSHATKDAIENYQNALYHTVKAFSIQKNSKTEQVFAVLYLTQLRHQMTAAISKEPSMQEQLDTAGTHTSRNERTNSIHNEALDGEKASTQAQLNAQVNPIPAELLLEIMGQGLLDRFTNEEARALSQSLDIRAYDFPQQGKKSISNLEQKEALNKSYLNVLTGIDILNQSSAQYQGQGKAALGYSFSRLFLSSFDSLPNQREKLLLSLPPKLLDARTGTQGHEIYTLQQEVKQSNITNPKKVSRFIGNCFNQGRPSFLRRKSFSQGFIAGIALGILALGVLATLSFFTFGLAAIPTALGLASLGSTYMGLSLAGIGLGATLAMGAIGGSLAVPIENTMREREFKKTAQALQHRAQLVPSQLKQQFEEQEFGSVDDNTADASSTTATGTGRGLQPGQSARIDPHPGRGATATSPQAAPAQKTDAATTRPLHALQKVRSTPNRAGEDKRRTLSDGADIGATDDTLEKKARAAPPKDSEGPVSRANPLATAMRQIAETTGERATGMMPATADNPFARVAGLAPVAPAASGTAAPPASHPNSVAGTAVAQAATSTTAVVVDWRAGYGDLERRLSVDASHV